MRNLRIQFAYWIVLFVQYSCNTVISDGTNTMKYAIGLWFNPFCHGRCQDQMHCGCLFICLYLLYAPSIMLRCLLSRHKHFLTC